MFRAIAYLIETIAAVVNFLLVLLGYAAASVQHTGSLFGLLPPIAQQRSVEQAAAEETLAEDSPAAPTREQELRERTREAVEAYRRQRLEKRLEALRAAKSVPDLTEAVRQDLEESRPEHEAVMRAADAALHGPGPYARRTARRQEIEALIHRPAPGYH